MLLTTLLVAMSADVARAQETIADVRFEGLNSVSTGYASSITRTEAGATFDQGEVDADVTRLLTTGKFTSVDAQVTLGDGGKVVTFKVVERPQIRSIEFVGNAEFSDRKLSEDVPLKIGDPIDIFRVRDGADAIRQRYRDKAFGQATVNYNEEALRESGALTYVIEEGPRVRIDEIEFEGLQNIIKGELLKRMTSKEKFWIFRDGKFDEEAVESDVATLQKYIRDEGYLDARVGYKIDHSDNREDITLTITVVEGGRYIVQSVEFTGNSVFTDEELSEGLELLQDEPFVQRKLEQSLRVLTDKYGAIGYIHADVRPVRVFSEAPGYVRIRFNIEEGERFRVGRIVVRGNERTKDKVVRRELTLFPGEWYDMPAARESENRLRQTRLFGTATVSPVGDQPGVRDVLVNVDEGRKAGDFIFGFGVTSNSGLVGSIVLDLQNFDLFDTPRSFSEFIKLRSFYGAGQRMRLEAQPGTDLNRFRIDFTEPYLFDKPTRFDFSAYFFERGRESYDESRMGASVSFGRRLKKWERLKDWYGELAFRVESVNVGNLASLAPRDVRDDEGSSLLTSIKASLIRDRTDSRFMPTSGDRLRLSYEQFGVMGGDFFGKASVGYTRHFTLATDEFERKDVLSLKGVGGYVVGDAPVYERYYAGGIGSIRGFDFRGVSVRQGLEKDQVGGEFMLLFSTEYSFPLYGKLLRGLVFTDMGTVEEGLEITDWRMSVGGGIRLQVDFFGPVPLEFDIAVPVVQAEDDDEQIFSFFIGATF